VLRLLVLLVAASLAAAEDKVDVATLVKGLNGITVIRENAVATLLERKDLRAVLLIEADAPDFTYRGQAAAVEVLFKLPEAQGGAALRRLLKAESPHLRFCAGLALYGKLEDAVTLAALSSAVDDKDLKREDTTAMVRRMIEFEAFAYGGAAEALVQPARTESFLIELFGTTTVWINPQALKAAATIAENDKRAVPRALAAAYLIRHRKAEYAAVLGKALTDAKFPLARFRQIQLMLLSSSKIAPEIAVKAIARSVPKQKNGTMVAAILSWLQAAKYPKLSTLSRKLIEHPNDEAALAAFAMLAALRDRPDTDALYRVIKNGPDGAALKAAALLHRADDEAGFERVLKCAQGNRRLRASAIDLLGEMAKPQAVGFLLGALEDNDPTVQVVAASAVTATLKRLFPYRRFQWPQALRNPRADAVQRAEAVAQVRTWWEKNKDADW